MSSIYPHPKQEFALFTIDFYATDIIIKIMSKKQFFIIIILILVLGALILIRVQPQPQIIRNILHDGAVMPVSLQEQIGNSRTTAIVLASQKVSPAVVSITVIQERIVTTSPFFSPFSDQYWDNFFRDFYPQRQFKQQIQGLGSGVIINVQGDIITNAHVVENATTMKVTLPDGRQFDGELIDVERTHDLAMIRIKGKDLPVTTLGKSDDLMIGEWCIAFGNPFGFLLEDAQPSVTVGVVSALNRTIKSSSSDGRELKNMIQTDAAINPGNSGGPLVNALGEVIGINTFIFTQSGGSEGIGFAIPVDRVKEFITQVKSNASKIVSEEKIEKKKTKIGVVVSDNNFTLMKKYNLTNESGMVVVETEQNSIASMLGIVDGDIIVSINNNRPKNATDLVKLTENIKNQLEMVIDRKGEQIRIYYRF
jgi:serine protease Do